MQRRLLFLLASLGLLTAGSVALWRRGGGDVPTYAEHVAPLVHARCAPCHHEGGVGPFSLLTYEDVVRHAVDIRIATTTRYMPPWRPVRGSQHYLGDRSLSDAEIDLLARFIDGGTPRGDRSREPSPPTFHDGWQLGEPDLVVELPEAYSLSAKGRDVYRNFVIPVPGTTRRWVASWEFLPETRLIHHAILNVDRLGLARKRDAEDVEPGFAGMDPGGAQSTDGTYLVWAPGKTPTPAVAGVAWRLEPGTDLVLQLHMQPSGKPETIRPRIGLHFTDRPPDKSRLTLRVGDPPIDIPPGEAHYRVHSEYVVPTPLRVWSVFPHAHYLARQVHTWAEVPGAGTTNLLQIDDWDFAWQDEYLFADPPRLPAGTKIVMEITYDNSTRNVRNPSKPPARVQAGERSVDEMGNVTFSVEPTAPGGLLVMRESKYRAALALAETARGQYNLANALVDLDRKDEAIGHYDRALALDPGLAPARFNLARLKVARGDLEGGIAAWREVTAASPDNADAWVELGNALGLAGQADAAWTAYEAAVRVGPDKALAHNALGLALIERKRWAAAIDELSRALAIEPDNWLSHHHLAGALAAEGRRDDALAHYRRAVALAPQATAPREALAKLEQEAR